MYVYMHVYTNVISNSKRSKNFDNKVRLLYLICIHIKQFYCAGLFRLFEYPKLYSCNILGLEKELLRHRRIVTVVLSGDSRITVTLGRATSSLVVVDLVERF